ncbi:MAG: DUF2442 domain-containing protein [Deltaproteobacteria bacterium]|nr:DUF2442 domain-containing protein [Deltaproteobacteria bacterium]
MYYEIKEARHIEGYKLEITFENGKNGIIDLQEYINKGGVFARFSDFEYFKRFYINKELGVLCWPDGLDIAPETLYHEATLEPFPAWIKKNEAAKRAV